MEGMQERKEGEGKRMKEEKAHIKKRNQLKYCFSWYQLVSVKPTKSKSAMSVFGLLPFSCQCLRLVGI